MKIALLFPGYGNQFVGMGKELYDEYRVVQEYFEEASNCLDINFVKLCFASSDIELGKINNAYTSLFLVGSSVYAVLKEHGIEPDVVMGYNNGESAALFAAGCFSLPDGLYLLNKFSSFYQEFIDENEVDAMQVIDFSSRDLEVLCEKISTDEYPISIAIYNSQTDHIVTGNRIGLGQLQDAIDGKGKIEFVGPEVGLHSLLMNTIVDVLKSYLEKVDFKDLKIPLISCIDGTIVTEGSDTKDRFIRHINSPIQFTKAMEKLVDYDCILITTPGDALAQMVQQHYPEKMVISIAKKTDVDTLKETLGK